MQQHQPPQLMKRDLASETSEPRHEQQHHQPPQASQPPQLQAYHLATVAPRCEQVQVSLNNAGTWRKFGRQNTEMIVTKAGRRMFPTLSLDVRGLDPAKKYEVYVTLLLADQHILKYQRGQWIPNGPCETYPPPGCTSGLVYVHPDSPASGRQWTKQEVTFMKLKLTNKLDGFDDPGRSGSMIFAYSMHKYLPVVHISEVPQPQAVKPEHQPAAPAPDRFYTSVVFPGTEFITVTAYQNPELTDLKIQYNPYAKGIRNQTDRSSTLLMDTFRPSVQAMQQQPQQPQQQPQQLQQQQQQRPQQQLHQPTQPQPDVPVEFGYYPNQTSSAYGHWQHQHLPQQHHSVSARRHQPYSLPAAPTAALESAPASVSATSPAVASRVCNSPTEGVADSTAAIAAASAAYYPASHHPYAAYLPQPHQMYYGSYYGVPQLHQDHQQLSAGLDYSGATHQSQQLDDQQLRYCASLTPPPASTSGQLQQLHHHVTFGHVGEIAVPAAHATPQGCSMLASSSHVTDSSPSGVSFNSPDL